MSDSTIVPVKVALYQAVALQLAGSKVQVEYADPGETMRRECVYIGDTLEGVEDQVAIRPGGTGRREENYSVDIVITVIGKASPQLNDERADALVSFVRSAINADPHLGGACGPGGFATVGGTRWEGAQSTDGPVSTVHVRIRVKGRTL